MNKRIILILLSILFVLTIGGFFVWKSQQSSAEVSTDTGQESKTENNNYPKVAEYQVPILMYHYIRNAEGESELGKNLSVSPENFASQIKYLNETDYQTLKMEDLADQERKTLSKLYFDKKKPIILTFDDGYLDAYTEAFPVLKKYGFIGTFYIIRDYVGKTEYMNQTQIDELEKAGMETGSHSMTHPDLSQMGTQEQRVQIFDSKQSTTSFCYPAGKYNDETLALVKDAGYTTAVTTKYGIVNQSSDLLELPRIRVGESSGQELLVKIEALLEQK